MSDPPFGPLSRKEFRKARRKARACWRYEMHDGETFENPDTGAIASLLNGGIGRGRSRIHGEVLGSGNERWRAGLGVRAGPGVEQVRGAVEPEHALRLLLRRRDRSLRRVNRAAAI